MKYYSEVTKTLYETEADLVAAEAATIKEQEELADLEMQYKDAIRRVTELEKALRSKRKPLDTMSSKDFVEWIKLFKHF